ncbi:MAG: cytochrome c [Mariprofundales bacterium]|nr:cytochrome c [Mariprofundales bacterium]
MKKLLMILLLCPVTGWSMNLPEADSSAAQLFSSRCSSCHALPHPKRLDWPHWQSMLRLMKRRMAERGMTMPNEEWHQIADYLKQHAR